MAEPNGGTTYNVKLWQIVLMLLVQLGGLAVSYGETRQQLSDVSERVSRLEQQSTTGISREEFDDFRQDMRTRMNRMEQEILDARGLHAGN